MFKDVMFGAYYSFSDLLFVFGMSWLLFSSAHVKKKGGHR